MGFEWEQGHVIGCGNERGGPVKGRQFADQLINFQLLLEDCTMQLVSVTWTGQLHSIILNGVPLCKCVCLKEYFGLHYCLCLLGWVNHFSLQ